MRWIYLFNTFIFLSFTQVQGVSTSSKRGLVYVPSSKYPADDRVWDSPTSDLTWYYNYGPSPSPSYSSSTKLQFVPMLFGAPPLSSDTSFLEEVRSQIRQGVNIKYALAFNEPDLQGNGGSNVAPDIAAEVWINQMEPLRKQGVKLGAPAVTGAPTGFIWLENFFDACSGKCRPDFIPIHWYGDFQGLASHIGQVRGTYPNMTIWVTEYAHNHVTLEESQSFFNSSAEYFDRLGLRYTPHGISL